MNPLPYQWGRDGSGVIISPPSRSSDLIFDAVAFKFAMVGRGTNASEQGAAKFLLVAFKAHRSVALPTRVGCEM